MAEDRDALWIRGDIGDGELRCAGLRLPLTGRTLRLVVWLAAQQARINATAAERGQLWLTWKGAGPGSISGRIETPL